MDLDTKFPLHKRAVGLHSCIVNQRFEAGTHSLSGYWPSALRIVMTVSGGLSVPEHISETDFLCMFFVVDRGSVLF